MARTGITDQVSSKKISNDTRLILVLTFIIVILTIIALYQPFLKDKIIDQNEITTTEAKPNIIDLEHKEFLFNKNLECQKLRDTLLQKFKTYNELSIAADIFFDFIFYSPKKNSCLYVDRISFSPNTENGKRLWDYNNDGVNSQPLEVCFLDSNCKDFDKKIEEYYKTF